MRKLARLLFLRSGDAMGSYDFYSRARGGHLDLLACVRFELSDERIAPPTELNSLAQYMSNVRFLPATTLSLFITAVPLRFLNWRV